MKLFTMFVFVMLCALAGAVKAGPIKISTGGETGAYYTSVGPNLAKVMDAIFRNSVNIVQLRD
jgi:TRAP-type uncharacterized transport system substrate-binding protein